MSWIIAISVLFLAELVYFGLAQKLNIIDKPNERSSHSYITIRGGGVVFLLAFWIWAMQQGTAYTTAGLGLLFIGIVSIWDDIKSLPNRVRILAHISGILLLFYNVGLFDLLPLGWIALILILVIGTLNAYNFMDGINGITGIYSLVTIASIAWINQQNTFLDDGFFVWMMSSLLVFLFFNFRKKARCFAGDVGSMGVAFAVLFGLFLLILHTGELKYILFLSIYGIDTVLTILQRLYRKENIFNAHRLHLYQLLVNQHGLSHRIVSFSYGLIQLILNILIIGVLPADMMFVTAAALILLPATAVYVSLKGYLVKKYRI